MDFHQIHINHQNLVFNLLNNCELLTCHDQSLSNFNLFLIQDQNLDLYFQH